MRVMPCMNRACLPNDAGHLPATRRRLPSAFRLMAPVILSIALNIVMVATAASNAFACMPDEEVKPATAHDGVTLPGAVELKGNAVQEQHPLDGPPDRIATGPTIENSASWTDGPVAGTVRWSGVKFEFFGGLWSFFTPDAVSSDRGIAETYRTHRASRLDR